MRAGRTITVTAFSIVVAIAVWGCSKRTPQEGSMGKDTGMMSEPAMEHDEGMMASSTMEEQAVTKAVAVLSPTEGNSVRGTVLFTKVPTGIRIVADVTGLTPGKHGFHIHAKGDCSSPDGTSAAGHFNPTDMPHGGPNDMERHVGDLGNLEADANGNAHYDRVDTVIAFQGEKSILGRGMIVHAGVDDLKSQPTGNAGARVACGVIEAQ